jgi:hypothetical protein
MKEKQKQLGICVRYLLRQIAPPKKVTAMTKTDKALSQDARAEHEYLG